MEEITLNPIDLWLHAIGWTLLGIAFVKLLVLDRKVILNKEFSWRFWIIDNSLDVLRGVVLTLISLKLGEVAIQVMGLIGVDFGGIAATIEKAGLDPVQISLVLAIIFQWWLYKRSLKRVESNQ